MKFTIEQRKRLIEILTLHGGMYGVENEEAQEFIEILTGQAKPIDAIKEMTRIIQLVSDATNVPVEDMKTKSRKSDVVMARSYAIYQIKEQVYAKCHISLADIGSQFWEGMDHASVWQAHRRINDWLEIGEETTMKIHNSFMSGHLQPIEEAA